MYNKLAMAFLILKRSFMAGINDDILIVVKLFNIERHNNNIKSHHSRPTRYMFEIFLFFGSFKKMSDKTDEFTINEICLKYESFQRPRLYRILSILMYT